MQRCYNEVLQRLTNLQGEINLRASEFVHDQQTFALFFLCQQCTFDLQIFIEILR